MEGKSGGVTCVASGGGRSARSRGAPAQAAGSTGRAAARSCRRGGACLTATAPCRSNGPLDETEAVVGLEGREDRHCYIYRPARLQPVSHPNRSTLLMVCDCPCGKKERKKKRKQVVLSFGEKLRTRDCLRGGVGERNTVAPRVTGRDVHAVMQQKDAG